MSTALSVVTRNVLADLLAAHHCTKAAYKLRRQVYLEQLDLLKSHIGEVVTALSVSWGSVHVHDEQRALLFEPSLYHPEGTYTTHVGRLHLVIPYGYISLEQTNAQGIILGWDGLPFLGPSSLREVRAVSSDMVLYYAPCVDRSLYMHYQAATSSTKRKALARSLFGILPSQKS